MRKISEIRGTEGVEIIGSLLPIIEKLIKKTGPKEDKSPMEYIGNMLRSNPHEALEMIAVIDGADVSAYEDKTLVEILQDVTAMLNDSALMELFGLQRQM